MKADLEARNAARIKEDEINWRLTNSIRRIGLYGIGGVRPTFRYTKEIGAYVRKADRGGIDWY